ncbi:DUF6544 family protein [Paenibacillus typhae]|uniref:DUF6544 family protein n=1 Tax=Paenibacillus typhae TaxID=1174501 RepID=UPI001C8E3C18|nr:DUF6544 family protein [Paenibacillus typhae]MBY0010744.1 hypothetical protein [Paenibacillus typhae]
MIVLTVTIICFAAAVLVFWQIPYSGTRAEFQKLASGLTTGEPAAAAVFTAEDWTPLPPPVRRYFETAGFTAYPKMSAMQAEFRKVKFSLGPGKAMITIGYNQVNSVARTGRIAFIDAKLYGIPFQGLDTYVEGTGGMKGVLGKAFTLFNQRGAEMDQACLVTFLSEALLLPSAALQSYITWKPIDNLHAEATISRYGSTASGIFTFRENGECQSFTTNDRTAVGMDGSRQKVRWSAYMDDYSIIDGIRQPTRLRAVWHYDEGDLVYFDSDNLLIEYR